MTAIVLNYSTSLFESLLKLLKNFFAAIAIGWMNGRQKAANARVAHFLATTEFKREDEFFIRNKLDEGWDIHRIGEELK